nr:KAT8 regulatory NSL complex subunit 3-like [Tanacetum cinerariifolium]
MENRFDKDVFKWCWDRTRTCFPSLSTLRNGGYKYLHSLIHSRVSCMVAAEDGIEASAVVCLGYPLKGTKAAIRDAPLLQLEVPTMFVQGTKDGLCPLASLEVVIKKMKAKNSLHVVENGDHSFKIAKKNLELAGITHEEAEQSAVQAIAMFVSHIIGLWENTNLIKKISKDMGDCGAGKVSWLRDNLEAAKTARVLKRVRQRDMEKVTHLQIMMNQSHLGAREKLLFGGKLKDGLLDITLLLLIDLVWSSNISSPTTPSEITSSSSTRRGADQGLGFMNRSHIKLK